MVVIKNEIRGSEWGAENQFPKEKDAVLVTVGAGESWDALVAESVRRGLWGIENLSGIPGTVGAAPIQNIGAYGVELQDVLQWVEALDAKTGKLRCLSNRECFFGYRDSIFKTPKGKDLIITRVALRLSKNGKPHLEYKDLREKFPIPNSQFPIQNLTPTDIRKAVLEIRSRKFPDLREYGTAGSFFKNPIISQRQFDTLKKRYPDLPGFELRMKDEGLRMKIPLAWILDHICGLKGFKKGAVTLFERQPIVLTAMPGATAEEIKKFAEEVIRRVHAKTGIAVEYEVIHIS
jgi:UDP-N-acetylmuramate dehydrogenase